jgi:hypothetical protein
MSPADDVENVLRVRHRSKDERGHAHPVGVVSGQVLLGIAEADRPAAGVVI